MTVDSPARLSPSAGRRASLLIGRWAVVVAGDEVPPWEARAFEAVNGLPDRLWPFVWAPMQAGSFVGSIAAAGLDRRRDPPAAARPRRAGGVPGGVLDGEGDQAVGRPRPTRGAAARRAPARAARRGSATCPGHAAVRVRPRRGAGAVGPAPWRPALFGGAAFVGLARQYAGVHLPLDVVGGAGSACWPGRSPAGRLRTACSVRTRPWPADQM